MNLDTSEMTLVVRKNRAEDDKTAIQLVAEHIGKVKIVERDDESAREETCPALVTRECRYRGLSRIEDFVNMIIRSRNPSLYYVS